jgi:hypothetical protein
MQRSRSTGAGCLVKIILVVSILMLFTLLFLAQGSLSLGVLVFTAIYVAFLAWFLSMPGRIRMIRRVLHRVITSDAHEYLTPLRVTFDREGFDCVSHWERRLRRWSAVERLVPLGDHFLLVHGGVVTLVIPKRVFAGPEETERFLAMVQAHLPSPAE